MLSYSLNLKNYISKFIYKTDTEAQTLKTNVWFQRGRMRKEGWIGGLGRAKENLHNVFCFVNTFGAGQGCAHGL